MEKMTIPASNHHVGSTERVFAAHVNDLNDFYLHSESVHTSLINLGKDLYAEYSKSYTKPFGTNETLTVGDYCACPSDSEDWYRGLIRQLDVNGLAVVFKIDYGDVQYVPINYLRPLQERFFKLNRLAFHCSLVNLSRPIDGWPVEVIEEFRSRLSTTFLYARSINYNEIRDISEVEITEKSSKIPLNKDFEQCQKPRSTSQMNDTLLYKYIPMETLEPNQTHQIRLLYYINPSRFYVYLPEKTNSHISNDLQVAIQNLRPIPSPRRYQPIAAQDSRAVWHRAIILDISASPTKIPIYFIDMGQREFISIEHIRPLPEEFQRKSAFAIPCSLNNVCSLNTNLQSTWESNDPVHDEFNRLMVNVVSCQVRGKQDQLYYEVDIDILKLGDLSTFLFGKNLVSRPIMQPPQRPLFNSGQGPNNLFARATQAVTTGSPMRAQRPPAKYPPPDSSYNDMSQQQPTHTSNTGLQTATRPPASNAQVTANSSPAVPVLPPQAGPYRIIQVHSAAEFYGLSQAREKEFNALSQHLADYYNNAPNNASVNVVMFFPNDLYVIHERDMYHRVVGIQRSSETRVTVKLIDRGDEIVVHTSELLEINKKFLSLAAFAQPFRLHDFDGSQNSTATTLNLKKMLLNQVVQIIVYGPMVGGFYPVDVKINNQSVRDILLSNDRNPSTSAPPPNNRPSFNQPPAPHYGTMVITNSTRHHASTGQDASRNFDPAPRANTGLPPPPKILTGSTTGAQAGRFGGGGGGTNPAAPSNDQGPRFSSLPNRPQPPQAVASSAPISTWNTDQNNRSNFESGGSNQQNFARQQTGPTQFTIYNQTDENRSSASNNSNRFPSNNTDSQPTSFEQKRPYGDDRNDQQPGENNQGGFRRGGGISNRGGHADREGRGGFNNRDMGRNNGENDENNSPSSRGFSRSTRGFSDRGGRDGGFRDQNQGDNQSQSYNRDRGEFRGGRGGGGYQDRQDQGGSGGFRGRGGGGYQDRRDQGESGGFRGRGGGGYQDRRDQGESGAFRGRGGPRGGFPSNRGGRDDAQSSSDPISTNAFSGWKSEQPTTANFEAGDGFTENEIPKTAFKFVVSHVETSNQFYIQLVSKGDEIGALTEVLQKEYKQYPEGNLSSLKLNQACLAKDEDGCWYRAVVLSTGLTKLKVRFIDFGNTGDVQSNMIRLLAKKHCASPPYAYLCTFKNAEAVESVKNETIVGKCAQKEFNGKSLVNTSDGKFILESDDLLKAFLDINAIKLKSEVTLKRIKCLIGHIESGTQDFYIQADEETLFKIGDLIEKEEETAPTLSLDEVKDLKPNTIVLARYDDTLYRGIIQSAESDDNVNICFVDYGNISSCPKDSLKRASEQLSSFCPQAKHCRLHGVPSDQINNALTYLGDNTDSENTVEISIVNEKDQIAYVLVYINNQSVNEKFGYDPNKDQTKTTTNEQSPSVVEAQKIEDVPSTDNVTPETAIKDKSETTVEDKSDQEVEDKSEAAETEKSEAAAEEKSEAAVEEKCETAVEEKSETAETEKLETAVVDKSEEAVEDESEAAETEKLETAVVDKSEEAIVDKFEEAIEDKSETPETEKLETATVEELEVEETSSKYRQGLLTHIEENQPYVYLQLYPESEEILDQINTVIQKLIKEDKHNPAYEIGEHVIAKFTVDDDYYRARIESYSTSSGLYTVYFLDFGNLDENVPVDGLYPYTDELKQIEPLAHGYLLNEVNPELWDTIVRPLVETYLNGILEFYYSDEKNSTIHMKFDNENEIYNQNDPYLSGTPAEDNNENVNEQISTDHIEDDNKQASDKAEKEESKSTDSSDSAIADGENTNEQSISHDEKIDRIDTTDNASSLSITNNQTIDFGENDPSTTIKDETNNSITSN